MKLARIALTPPIAAISVSLSVALGARAFGGDLPAEYDRLDYIDSDGSAGSCLVLEFKGTDPARGPLDHAGDEVCPKPRKQVRTMAFRAV